MSTRRERQAETRRRFSDALARARGKSAYGYSYLQDSIDSKNALLEADDCDNATVLA
jgi:hypothetical protein